MALPQAKNDILARPPEWTAIEGVNFTDFCNNIAHGILSCYKLHVFSISSQTKYGNFT